MFDRVLGPKSSRLCMYICSSSKVFSEALESLSSKKVINCTFFNILPIRFNVFDFATFFVLLTLSNRGGSTSEKFELAVQIFMWSS